uniref:hypothetical protein n=1 Tax=Clostridium sp. NkU-1 TaxID=1095009 RepID=UPI0006D03AC9
QGPRTGRDSAPKTGSFDTPIQAKLPATGPQRTLIKMADLIKEIKMMRLRKEHRARVESH